MSINDFYSGIVNWLEQKQILNILNDLLQNEVKPTEVNPSKNRLWYCYLLGILPIDYQRLAKSHPRYLEHLSYRLTELNNYSVQQQFVNLVEDSLLKYLAVNEKQTVIERLQLFHSQLDDWTTGDWHGRIIEDRLDALRQFERNNQLDTLWQASEILSGSGYHYPFSVSSYHAWLRYSGAGIAEDDYFDWFDTLAIISDGIYGGVKKDFILEHVFSKNADFGLVSLCDNPSSCRQCPVGKRCVHFANTQNDSELLTLENEIKLNDGSQLPKEKLIQYLAKGKYQGTDCQKRMIADFPDLAKYNSVRNSESSEDEAFLLFLKALKEIGNRPGESAMDGNNLMFNDSKSVAGFLKAKITKDFQESFYTLILDNKHKLISLQHITKGTLNQSLVHPREVFAPAIRLRAAAIILVHNHPSGDPQPSNQDIEITKRLINAGNIVGISVLDHVIMGDDSYFSFVDEDIVF